MQTFYKRYLILGSFLSLVIVSCQDKKEASESNEENPHAISASEESENSMRADLTYPGEHHFKNIRQLTFGGDNAEAYWSFDDTKLVFQSNYEEWGVGCDQIFYMDLENANLSVNKPEMLSTGLGRTTCPYFLPGNKTIVYASTHQGGEACPEEPQREPGGKYLWPIYSSYDIYTADLEGNIINQLTREPGYDAEATVSAQGDKIVFTSTRTGDLELFVMDIDGSNVVQVTNELGYDGGAFFSPDGTKLVFRSSRPKTDEEIKEYKDLLAQGLVQPTEMEIYTVNIDGTELEKITNLGAANWAPFYHPSGEKIIFSSNHAGSRGFSFNLYMINTDGTGLEQISHDKIFDSFPMFSYDGKKIIFSSNRNNNGTYDTNLFVADWVD